MKPTLQIVSLLLVFVANDCLASPPEESQDTLWHNVEGYTSTAQGLLAFSVLAVGADGKVLATGDDSLLERYPEARRRDGHGLTLLPGLTDAHAHLYGQGLLASQVDLVGVASLDAAVERVRDYADGNPLTPWILGRGWNQVLWEAQEFPNARDLDAAVRDRPVWLRRIDGHAGWANTHALELAGIDRDTPDPVGGKIIRSSAGDATGILIDTAMNYVEQLVPLPDKRQVRDAYRLANESLVALGLTGVHDAGVTLAEAEVLIAMAEDGELDLRVYAMLRGAGENLDGFGEPIVAHADDRLDDRLEIRAVKIYADGALGSRGAAMLEPYSDDVENRGLPFFTQDELTQMVIKANDRGFQVAVHAIGDLGNRMVIDAFETAGSSRQNKFRNRIEHVQIVALEDIQRIADLGLIASVQPIHATSDMNMAEDRVGPERILGGYAWRRLLDAGAVIASGSDFPVELPNPFFGLHAAVTRQSRDEQPADGWYADQALSREEALHSFTLAAAYAAHQEDRLGSLEPGKWADFIIIDRNYFEIPANQIDDIVVLETWIGGKRVFRQGRLNNE
ncbi:MAG: amidohydrolase [Pseudomonadota bacterium]